MSLSKFIIFFLSFFISISCSIGQSQFAIEDLSFQNKKEKKLFQMLQQKEIPNLLDLALISSDNYKDSTSTICSQSYNELLIKLKKGISKKWSKARISRYIHKKIQKDLLKKYSTYANFEDIFQIGQFNCVTATMLYALVFDDLNISYEIRLKPFHVYLVIEPEHEELVLETTDFVEGIDKIDFEVKKEYIDLLVKSKKISFEELQTKSIQSLYNEYYFAKEQVIDFQGLVASQYYNNATLFISKKQFKDALHHIEKSEFLLPSLRNHYILFQSLYRIVSDLDYSSPENVKPLFKLYQLYPTIEIKNEILQQFTLLSDQLVFKNGAIQKFNSFYKAYEKGLKETDVLLEIQEIYYSQLAKAYCLSYDHKAALVYAEKAHQVNPKNISTKRLFSDIVFDYTYLNNKTENIFSELEKTLEKYSFLTLDPRISKLLTKQINKTTNQGDVKLLLKNSSQSLEIFNSSLFKIFPNTDSTKIKNKKSLEWFKIGLQFLPNYHLFQQVISE